MAQYGLNPIFKRVNRNSLTEDIVAAIGASTTFNAGDFLTFNLTTKTFGTLAGESDSVNFAGVAVQSISSGKQVSAYTTDTDSALGYASVKGPEFGDEVFAVLKAGDTITPGQEVYFNSGSQSIANNTKCGVTTTVGTKAIGIYFGPSLTGAPTNGTIIPIKLFCNFKRGGFAIGPVLG
jgi:hypothetical protein